MSLCSLLLSVCTLLVREPAAGPHRACQRVRALHWCCVTHTHGQCTEGVWVDTHQCAANHQQRHGVKLGTMDNVELGGGYVQNQYKPKTHSFGQPEKEAHPRRVAQTLLVKFGAAWGRPKASKF